MVDSSIMYLGPLAVLALISSKATTPPFTTFFFFDACVELYGKNIWKNDRNHIEWPPAITYSSFTEGEKTKSQNASILFRPFVFSGLLPEWRLISTWFQKISWKLQTFDVLSTHDAWIVACAGVIESVSGFRLETTQRSLVRMTQRRCGWVN